MLNLFCNLPRIFVLSVVFCLRLKTFAFSPSSGVHSAVGFTSELVSPLSMSEMGNSDNVETPSQPVVKCPNCDKCDGSGRILGGIPTILPWWPIKPYRPCPNFIANGGKYSRVGQPLDEIAFGRGNIDREDDEF